METLTNPQDVIGRDQQLAWFDRLMLSASISGGGNLGWHVGVLLGDPSLVWLCGGLGVGVVGGLGYSLHATFRPNIGHPSGAIRIFELGMIVGLIGYLTARWLGPAGPFLAILVLPIFLGCLIQLYRIVTRTARVVIVWLGLKEVPQPNTDCRTSEQGYVI